MELSKIVHKEVKIKVQSAEVTLTYQEVNDLSLAICNELDFMVQYGNEGTLKYARFTALRDQLGSVAEMLYTEDDD